MDHHDDEDRAVGENHDKQGDEVSLVNVLIVYEYFGKYSYSSCEVPSRFSCLE